jgi:hypothetical protein
MIPVPPDDRLLDVTALGSTATTGPLGWVEAATSPGSMSGGYRYINAIQMT